MRKKALIVGAVFVFFLVVGLWYNLTPGRYFGDDFWRLKDGAYIAWNGDSIRPNDDGTFALRFADRDLMAVLDETEAGFRVDFSDGWAIEQGSMNAQIWAEIGGVMLSGDTKYILTDMEKANLRFGRVVEEVSKPFYGEDGKAVGESRYFVTETGESVGWQEIWYEQPEFSTPEQQTLLLEEGTALKSDDFYHSLMKNEDGDYLMNAQDARMMEMSGNAWRDRGSVAAFLIRMTKNEPDRRGHIEAVFLYALVYLLGAANFLWPEKLAFFGSRWQFRNEPELSDEGLFMMQLGSVVSMVLGIILLFIQSY